MRHLKLTLAYDGTRYVGWQRQAEGASIQGVLEDVLARFEGAPVIVQAAGRTDAGVHALGQVASAAVTFQHDASTLRRALNAQLPDDIRVLQVEEALEGFHARFDARRKTYRYQIRAGQVASPFDRAFVWQFPDRLDVEAMDLASRSLVGTHDFAAFQSVGSDMAPGSGSVRTILTSEMVAGASGLLLYEVSGTGFLRHMVRAIVGTLVEVGRGWRTPSQVASLLRGARRADAGATAPAHGLMLVRVDYD